MEGKDRTDEQPTGSDQNFSGNAQSEAQHLLRNFRTIADQNQGGMPPGFPDGSQLLAYDSQAQSRGFLTGGVRHREQIAAQPSEVPAYHSDYDKPHYYAKSGRQAQAEHHLQAGIGQHQAPEHHLQAGLNQSRHDGHTQEAQQPEQSQDAKVTDTQRIDTGHWGMDRYHRQVWVPSHEDITATMLKSQYKDGASFQILPLAQAKGQYQNYYNGLADVHMERGNHIVGTPVHLERGNDGRLHPVASYGKQIDLSLHYQHQSRR